MRSAGTIGHRGRSALGLATALVVLGSLALVAVAGADRKPTPNEKRAIAKVMELPKKCAKIRVSTVSESPLWASGYWKPRGERCEPFAADGVVVLKNKGRRWKFVTAGSAFECPGLYRDVPKDVAKDLGIACN